MNQPEVPSRLISQPGWMGDEYWSCGSEYISILP